MIMGVILLANTENVLQQILESQLFMQNQFNRMQGQMDSMQAQINSMQGQMDSMQAQININHKDVVERLDKLENNHKDVTKRLDRLELNQDAMKKFMFESDKSFKKSEETYKIIQDIKNIFAKED